MLAALAAVYVVWLISVSRLWHFYLPEDWLIFVGRPDPTVDGLLAPFNGHWFTLTVALAGPMAGVALSALLLVLAASYENLYWLVEFGFVAPVVFALAALRLADAPEWSRRRWVAIAALLLAGVMSSGVGLVMLVVVGVYLFGSRRMLVVVPAGVAYLVWATLWPSAYQLPGEGHPIAFAASVLGSLGTALFSSALPGGAILSVGVFLAAVAVVAGWRPHRLTWAAAAGVAALYLGVGIRGDWVPELAAPGRYLYPAVACILVGISPVIMLLPIAGRLALAAVLVVAMANNVAALPRTALGWERSTLFFRAQTTVVERARIPSAAFIEPYGLHAVDYLRAIDRFGIPDRSSELEARLARPEMEAFAEGMRQRLGLSE